MPKYNYKCLKCENVFDIEVTIKEKEDGCEKLVCPKCGSKEIKQNFSGFNSLETAFSDSDDDCCSGEDVCDINCKPDEKEESSCGCGGCC